MIPILHADLPEFIGNGYGFLSDTIKARVLETLNGGYTLELTYPLKGIHAEHITERCIIYTKVSDDTFAHFRIYRINPASKGTMKIYANHISYDLMGIPVEPFTAASAADAMNAISQHAVVDCPFSFYTNKTTAAALNVSTPKSIWKLLGGSKGSILDVYGGEYLFEDFGVYLLNHRGFDNGVTIRYGKNLSTLEQDRNCANVYTGIYPYWSSDDGTLVQLPEKIIHAAGTYNFERILDLDFRDKFNTVPTEEQLRQRAVAYMEDNQIGVPTVSWKVSFVHLDQTDEYRHLGRLESVALGDTVYVIFPDMNVNASARVVETDYDPILERYNSVTLGRVRSNFADTVLKQQEEIKQKPGVTELTGIISDKLGAIFGTRGGAVRLLDTNGDGQPDELYIADNADPNLAMKVWRFNYEGWAASSTGYNGTFTMGATLDDGLLANFVTAANLVAGTIKSRDGEAFFLDLDNGILRIKAIGDLEESVDVVAGDLEAVSEEVDNKVNVGEITAGLNVETEGVRLTGNRVTINSTNFKLSGSGEVTTKGSFTTESGGLETNVNGGAVYFKQGGQEIAKLKAGAYPNAYGEELPVLIMDMVLNGTVFGIGGTPKMIVNNGLNPDGQLSDVILNDVTVNDDIKTYGQVIFQTGVQQNVAAFKPSGTDFYDGEIGVYQNMYINDSLYVNGELSVRKDKERVVCTKNYGTVSLYCVESASPYFSDIGSVVLDENGYGEVWIDPIFEETVDVKHEYYVFLSEGYAEKSPGYFTIYGKPGGTVDWIIYYRQFDSTTARLNVKPTVEPRINPLEMEINKWVFAGEDAAPAIAESLMEEYPDTIEQEAESYLKNYEQEIYGYDY